MGVVRVRSGGHLKVVYILSEGDRGVTFGRPIIIISLRSFPWSFVDSPSYLPHHVITRGLLVHVVESVHLALVIVLVGGGVQRVRIISVVQTKRPIRIIIFFTDRVK